jgi:hypothetical protein
LTGHLNLASHFNLPKNIVVNPNRLMRRCLTEKILLRRHLKSDDQIKSIEQRA